MARKTNTRRSSRKKRVIQDRKWLFLKRILLEETRGVYYFLMVTLLTLYFVQVHQISYIVVSWSLLPALILGFVLSSFQRLVNVFQEWISTTMGRVLVGFLLFFIYVIGFILLFSLVVSFPVGWIIERVAGSEELAVEYALFAVNFITLHIVQ